MNKDEINRLIVDNLKLVYFVLRKMKLYNHKGIDKYYDLGMIGLVKGCKSYNGSTALSTYLCACISNEIKQYYKNQNTAKRGSGVEDISLNILITTEDSKSQSEIIDMIPDKLNIEEDLIYKELLDMVYKEINKLSQRNKEILLYSYGLLNYDKLEPTVIANKYGISRQRLYKINKRSLEQIRENLKHYR